MSIEPPEQVALRVRTALASGSAIDYGSGFTDKEYPEIAWSMCGLPNTNEIAVVATVGRLQLGRAHPSSLIHPAMIDRIFGIDVDDQRLALWLSEQLWIVHSDQLVEVALSARNLS